MNDDKKEIMDIVDEFDEAYCPDCQIKYRVSELPPIRKDTVAYYSTFDNVFKGLGNVINTLASGA